MEAQKRETTDYSNENACVYHGTMWKSQKNEGTTKKSITRNNISYNILFKNV